MNANIAELIMGLDDVTAGFSRDFDDMRSKTGWESVIGIFSSAKSDSMRQERVRSVSIDDKLQDLIAKSDTILQLLEGQLAVLEEQRSKVEVNLTDTLTDCEATVAELESLRADIGNMDPEIIKLENAIASETDAAKRTALETQLAEANSRYNAMAQEEQVKLAKSQTLERYIDKGKTWVDSLQNQAATQMVLINKLQTDTKQRVVLYDALTKSFKTAQQQGVDLTDLSRSDLHRLAQEHSDILPEEFHTLGHLVNWAENGGAFPNISSADPVYFYTLRAADTPDAEHVNMLLAELAPKDIRQLFICHKELFYRTYRLGPMLNRPMWQSF